MVKLKVVEKFISINGEGRKQGELAAFIRLGGCNLRCTYCDTAWAWAVDGAEAAEFCEETPSDIYAWVKANGVKNVTLTGGEPLLHPHAADLLVLLCADPALSVEVETNGSVDLAPFMAMPNPPAFTVDYKLPKSGMESKMHLPSFALLGERDVVKFVCTDMDDLARAYEVMQQMQLIGRVGVFLSPVFGSIDVADMVDFMQQRNLNGVRLQLQMHKFIWSPDKRGV